MPVTARLSSRFYEKLGDEAANELVNWLNSVDIEFRTKLDDASARSAEVFRTELGRAVAELRADLRAEIGAFRTEVHASLESHMRWTITLWVTTLIAVVGLKFI